MQGGSEIAGAAIGAVAAGGTVMAAAANQTGMPDVVSGVENTPEGMMNEKAASGLSMSMNEKLRQGSDVSANTKQQQGKWSTSADQFLRDLDNRVDQFLRDLDNRVDRKMQDGTLEGLNSETDKLAYNGKKDETDRRKSMESDKGEKGDGNDFDDGRTDTDLTDLGDPGDLDEWLAGDVLPAEVAVDEGGALQATLALEEELKQAVNAGAIKTLQEVEAEELEEALKEEDSRLKKYWKKFTVFGIIVAIVVGVSAGLTRGKAKNLTFMELEDICNYTNTRAPWLRSAVSIQMRWVCSFGIILLHNNFLTLFIRSGSSNVYRYRNFETKRRNTSTFNSKTAPLHRFFGALPRPCPCPTTEHVPPWPDASAMNSMSLREIPKRTLPRQNGRSLVESFPCSIRTWLISTRNWKNISPTSRYPATAPS